MTVNCSAVPAVFAFQTMLMQKLSVSIIFNSSMLLLAARLPGYAVLPWLHNPWLVLCSGGVAWLHFCYQLGGWYCQLQAAGALSPERIHAGMASPTPATSCLNDCCGSSLFQPHPPTSTQPPCRLTIRILLSWLPLMK